MELVLEKDNDETAWRILRALQELCNNAQGCRGGIGKNLKGKTQRDEGQARTLE